jgi:hypothetical protein
VFHITFPHFRGVWAAPAFSLELQSTYKYRLTNEGWTDMDRDGLLALPLESLGVMSLQKSPID